MATHVRSRKRPSDHVSVAQHQTPVDISVGASLEVRHEHVEQRAVADEDNIVIRVGCQVPVGEGRHPMPDLFDRLPTAPGDLRHVGADGHRLGAEVAGQSALQLSEALLTKQCGRNDADIQASGDDFRGLCRSDQVAREEADRAPQSDTSKDVGGFLRLPAPTISQGRVHVLPLHPTLDVPGGLTMTDHEQHGANLLARAAGLALGIALDRTLGDPQRWHPVAGFGRWAGWLGRKLWRDSRTSGAVFTLAALTPLLTASACAERAANRLPDGPLLRAAANAASVALVTWTVVGGRQLADTGRRMADLLEVGDVAGARGLLPHLCGRAPDGLDESELARATIESLAENTSDAIIGSLVWGAALGLRGLVLHRAANTLDAMVGHRHARYARFGTASARLDDVLNLLPARATGVLFTSLAPLVGGQPRHAWRTLVRDHSRHPSPNGGWCEAAMAGALGVRLGGRNLYPGDRVEDRPLLGAENRACTPDDVRRAARLVEATTLAATSLVVAVLTGAHR